MSLMTAAKQQMDKLLSKASTGERRFREDAWGRLESLGMPKRGTETWKYTSIAPLDMMNWTMAIGRNKVVLPENLRAWIDTQKTEFDVAVLVNGELLSDLSKLSSEIQISSAALEQNTFSGEDGFASASAAVARPGLMIRVAANVRAPRPLLIVKYQDAADGWISTLNQIELGARAELSVGEVFIGGEAPYLRTDLLQARVQENARLQWLRLQKESASAFHFAESHVQLAANCHFHFTQVNRGGHWLRSQMFVDLEGKGAEAFVHGLTYGGDRQHIDQRVVLSHKVGENMSSQLFKGVLKDSAKGVVNGKIYIAEDARKVSSQQFNHNLLLSPGAEANTKPELEIFADDVKANHGATVGRLDEEKMFYLRSRGITETEAEKLLSESFVAEVLMKIPNGHLRRLAGDSYEH